MKTFKKIIQYSLYVLIPPLLYVVISLVLSFITIDRVQSKEQADNMIYLSTNGVHLDIVIPLKNIDNTVLSGINHGANDQFLSFGWGDENFYINTPTWGDLTFSNAFKALFLKSSTLMHVTRFEQLETDWVEIHITNSELHQINKYIGNTFQHNENGKKIILENKGYTPIDDFYKSKGSYSCFKTCNSWVNTGFKESGLKSCLWTPFDFGLMNKY